MMAILQAITASETDSLDGLNTKFYVKLFLQLVNFVI